MSAVAGVTQSVNRAFRLLSDLPDFEAARPETRPTARVVTRRSASRSPSRRWRHAISEARRELGEAADALAKPRGASIHGRLQPSVRVSLWGAIMLLGSKRNQQEPALQLANRIVQALRSVPQQMETDFQRATRRMPTLSPQFRPPPPSAAAQVEYRARLQGDPRPPRVSSEDFQFYLQIMNAAILDADLYAYSEEAQNPKLYLLVNLVSLGIGSSAPGPTPSCGDVANPESAIRSVIDAATTDVVGRVAYSGGLLPPSKLPHPRKVP